MFHVTRIKQVDPNTAIIVEEGLPRKTYLDAESLALMANDNHVYCIRDDEGQPVDKWYYYNGMRLLRWDDAYPVLNRCYSTLHIIGDWIGEDLSDVMDDEMQGILVHYAHHVDSTLEPLVNLLGEPFKFVPIVDEEDANGKV